MEKYGYIRVSSKEQNTDRQLVDALTDKEIQKNHLFTDKMSGKSACKNSAFKSDCQQLYNHEKSLETKCFSFRAFSLHKLNLCC